MSFNIPIVLFIFKRTEKTVAIVRRIKEILPQKIYLLGDGPRNNEEYSDVLTCRERVKEEIDWDCDLITHYHQENVGVYGNIAKGIIWVLNREAKAIFLEDDSFPETTFFEFCRQMLNLYEADNRILWIQGSNYLKKYSSPYQHSYVFTRHMLPCGWATWSNKFLSAYDIDLNCLDDKYVKDNLNFSYFCNGLSKQLLYFINETKKSLKMNKFDVSWDYQMDVALCRNGQFGIIPCNNQIRNIGVDNFSTHGGVTLSNPMTRRFCELDTFPINFPLVHPSALLVDDKFEKKIAKIRKIPMWYMLGIKIAGKIRKIFHIQNNFSFSKYVFNIFKHK